MKWHVTAILDLLIILSTRLTSKKTHDSPLLRTMLNRLKKYGVGLAGSIFNADKAYNGERNFESLFGICVLPNIKQRTNAKVKTGKRRERYSMRQYIIIEDGAEDKEQSEKIWN